MIGRGATYLKELARCTRHNLLHLRTFHISYRKGMWRASDGDVSMTFPYYPYLAFHDIEGYLHDGRWKPTRGMTVVDAGGCFGEFALYAAKCVGPEGRVLMLEPDPKNVARAREVFEMNGNPANLEIVQAGLWRTRGTIRFDAGHGATSAIVENTASAASSDSIEIPTHSLASLVSEFHLDRLDLVKMDIEGAELEAVTAAFELPAGMKPRYAIASYHVVNGRRTAEQLEEIFPAMQYHCRSGYPNHLTTWAAPSPIDP